AHLLASSKSEILREKSSDRRGVFYPEKNILQIRRDSLPQFDRT
ncbi:4278_t:CDS:1, partial [Funneliformis geosporum]